MNLYLILTTTYAKFNTGSKLGELARIGENIVVVTLCCSGFPPSFSFQHKQYSRQHFFSVCVKAE